MSSPGAGPAVNDYRLKTYNCKMRPIPHAEGGRVERGLGRILKTTHYDFVKQIVQWDKIIYSPIIISLCFYIHYSTSLNQGVLVARKESLKRAMVFLEEFLLWI